MVRSCKGHPLRGCIHGYSPSAKLHTIQGGPKKGNPLLATILKYFLEVIDLSVYIFGKFRLFCVSGEEIVEKDARMSLRRLFEHI